MNTNKWKGIFSKLDGYWEHDENPKRPHALLTSKKHSNGYFNGSMVVRQPDVLRTACEELIEMIGSSLNNCSSNMQVFGSANGAVGIACMMGYLLKVPWGFTEPVIDDNGVKQMVLKRFPVQKDENILVVEDVGTTWGTTLKTIKALEDAGAVVINKVGVFVNRSGKQILTECAEDKIIVPLIDVELPTWDVPGGEECPLCKIGSEALPPKANWDKLNAKY